MFCSLHGTGSFAASAAVLFMIQSVRPHSAQQGNPVAVICSSLCGEELYPSRDIPRCRYIARLLLTCWTELCIRTRLHRSNNKLAMLEHALFEKIKAKDRQHSSREVR